MSPSKDETRYERMLYVIIGVFVVLLMGPNILMAVLHLLYSE